MAEFEKKFRAGGEFPVLSDQGKKIANDMINLKVCVPTPDGPMDLAPAKITEADIRREAKRIADIRDPDQRALEVAQCMASFLEMTVDAQEICRFALQASAALERVPAMFKALKGVKDLQVGDPIKDDGPDL
jgi:hypothetical protein